jgi:hypothetical protein
MGCQVLLELDIELNQAVHGNRNGDGFETGNPYVGKPGILGTLAVPTSGLCNDGHYGKEDTDEAVLENRDPYNLRQSQ